MLRAGSSCHLLIQKWLHCDGAKFFKNLNAVLSHGNGITPLCKNQPSPFTGIPLRGILWGEYCVAYAILQRSYHYGLTNPILQPLSPSSCISIRGLHSTPPRRQQDNRKDDDDKDNKNKDAQLLTKLFIYSVVGAMVATALFASTSPSDEALDDKTVDWDVWVPHESRVSSYLSWNEFVHQMLAKGEVQQIIVYPELGAASILLHDGAVVKGKPVTKRIYRMNIVDITRFEEKLRETEAQLGIKQENGVPVVFERSSDTTGRLIALFILCFLIWSIFSWLFNSKSFKMMDGVMGQFTKAKFTLVDPVMGSGRGVKFSDIAGLKEAKQEIMEFVDYLKKPEHYRRLGAKVPKGTLLLGPPGCGKTLLAKAVATEANVPFLSMNGTEFVEMIGGLGASRVRDLFKEARKRSPCIIYIDEIDAIGRKRFDHPGSEGDHTLNQLLVELDGMATKEGVIMLASTNRSDILDKALMRPGRFDRHILIDLPTMDERKEIFETHLKNIVLEESPSFYSKRLAHLTPGYSGADIANICNEAALHAARFQQKKVRSEDLEYAVDRVQLGVEKKSQSVTAPERQKFAYYLAGRTLVGWMLKNTDAMLKVSIIQRSKSIGSLQLSQSERFLISNEELYDRMIMNIGGRAAESLVFNQTSTIAEEDLKKVTNIAYKMVQVFGMNDNVGLVSFPKESNSRKPMYSRKLHGLMDFEVRKLITEIYETAESILKENDDKFKLLASELLKRETLSYEDICNLIGPPPHGHKRQVEGIDFGSHIGQDSDSAPPDNFPPPTEVEKDEDDRERQGPERIPTS